MFMGFTLHFYIIFGTNLLTGPARLAVFFAYFSVSKKRNIKWSPNVMKPSGAIFLEQTQSRTLGVDVKQQTRRPRGCPVRPPPFWDPRGSTDLLLPPIYIHVPRKYPGAPRKLFPPPQPSVSARSHLGAFVGAPPEGESTMEGLYIISKASPLSCE